MASASLGHGGVGYSRTVSGFNESSSASAVDRLGRGMLEMRLRDKVERDDDKVSVSYCTFFDIAIVSIISSDNRCF